MIIEKYTKHSIFSLPQIFYEILTRFELKANKFVNMYINDLNNPLLSNHIFLVFKDIKPYLLKRLKTHKLYYCNYLITINKITYTVIAFAQDYVTHAIVNKINLGLYERLSYDAKILIMTFWHSDVDTAVHNWLFNPLAKVKRPVAEHITIADTKSPNS